MSFEYDLAMNYIKWLAVMCRMSAFIITMPLFTSSSVPMQYKAGFIAVLSFMIMPVVPAEWYDSPMLKDPTVISILLFMLSEMAIGLVVSLVFFAALEIFEFGGSSIDREIGFSMAQVMDPVSNISTTLFSNLLIQTFIMVFLIFDGHHEVIRIAVDSFRTLPPGSLLINADTVSGMNNLIARVLIVGFQLSMPIMAVNLLINVAMANPVPRRRGISRADAVVSAAFRTGIYYFDRDRAVHADDLPRIERIFTGVAGRNGYAVRRNHHGKRSQQDRETDLEAHLQGARGRECPFLRRCQFPGGDVGRNADHLPARPRAAAGI